MKCDVSNSGQFDRDGEVVSVEIVRIQRLMSQGSPGRDEHCNTALNVRWKKALLRNRQSELLDPNKAMTTVGHILFWTYKEGDKAVHRTGQITMRARTADGYAPAEVQSESPNGMIMNL